MSWPINLRGKGRRVSLPPTTAMEAWFRKGVGITSAANAVSNWANQAASGAARDLAQATGASQPTLQAGGTIVFDGTSDFLKCIAFTLNQPETVYLRARQITWAANDYIHDGNATDSGNLFQSAATPGLGIYAGTALTVNNASAIGVWSSLACVYNGASSVLQVDTTSITGNAGAANMGGFTLGAVATGTSGWGNIEVAEVVIYSAAHDAAQRAAVIAYLNTL